MPLPTLLTQHIARRPQRIALLQHIAEQGSITRAAKSAGMKYAVLTTKHHVNSQQPDMLLTDYDQLRCNFLLNCAPNRDGLMDENVVRRLAGVGKAREANPPSQR